MTTDPFDPADPRTWPPWMRLSDICTEGDRRGPYPGSRYQWRARAPPPVKFGTRISCWHRSTVAAICHLPPPDPADMQIEQPVAAEHDSPAPASASRNSKRRTSRSTAVA
jgi:hypothetical protein